jgi:hypothetical protein
MRVGPHAGRDHHVDQVRRVARPVAQSADLRPPRTPLRRIAPMLQGIAVALRRARPFTIAGIRTVRRNIIVRRNARGGTLPWARPRHAEVRPRPCAGGASKQRGLVPRDDARGRTEILYRTALSFLDFAIRIRRAPARHCCAGIKRFLHARGGRTIVVQNLYNNVRHALLPFVQHPDMGSARARSRCANCIGLYATALSDSA